MRKALRIKANKLLKEHRFKRRWAKTVTALSLAVALGMSYALILPAVTMEDETYCGYEQHAEHDESCYTETGALVCALSEEGHAHSESCYEVRTSLSCGLEENDGHVHSDGCYGEQTSFICGLEETGGHVHADGCLDENGELLCGLAEGEGAHHHDESCRATETVLLCGLAEGDGAHHHDESCYTAETILVCETEESEPHEHGDDCYSAEKELTCTLPLHEHTLQCYSDPEADVESRDTWEHTFNWIELSGKWDEDVLAVAKTQIGYRESEKNYLVAEDGFTKNGYTRYGDWCGDPYGDWSAMFCSFCLHYAGVPASLMPLGHDCLGWTSSLAGAGLYRAAGSGYSPKAGDLIFFDQDGNGAADHVGFIFEINENAVKTIEGDSGDQVRYGSYYLGDTCIAGYGELPENPNLPAAAEPSEDTSVDGGLSQEDADQEAGAEEAGVEEKTITAAAEDGATATITGNLPEDAEATIVPVVLTEAEVAAYLGRSRSVSVQSYVVYDITIWSNGEEWQPDDTVSVTITTPDIEIGENDRFAVAHVDDEGTVSDVEAGMAEDGSIAFTAEGFSLYIIYTYTVDFHYGDLSYSIRGESSILLSELFEALGIEAALSEVESVAFSDESLIHIQIIVNAENERDWKLVSLNPFETMEELTITLKDGQVITIHVTDANEGSNPLPVTESPDYVGTYPTGDGSNDWQITAQQYAGRAQSQKIPVDSDRDGKTDVYLQKNVVPTATENEFLVYLSVDKQTTWEEFLNDSRVALTTSASYKNDPPGTVYQSIHGNVTAELAEHGNQGTYSNQYYIRFNVWQNHSSAQPLYSYYDWRYGNTSNCSNASAFLRVPGLGYICVAKEVNLHVAGNGQSNPFVLDIYLSDGLQSDLTFYNTVFTEVTDALGDNIEFLEILNSDGAASYDPGAHTITWTPEDWQTVIPDFNYPPLSAWMENVIQLVYKVRLNVEADGFESCADTIDDEAASIAAGESNPVNTSAVLTFDKIPLPRTNGIPEVRGLEAKFPVPEVRGLLYDVSLVKQNEDGEALAGAVFGLFETDRTTPVTVDGVPLTFTTEADGIGRLTGLPFGDYVIKEIHAPPGYFASPSRWDIHMCYTDAPGDFEPDEAPFDHNMRFTRNDVGGQWIVVNPEDPINIPELPDVPEPPKWVPDLEPPLTKQIDYLGDNDGTTDFDNPDTTLDDNGIAGRDDLYRLYLNLQGDSTGIDLVLVLDASNSMGTPMGNSTRRGNLLDFLNGTGGDPGFVTNFLAAHPDNRLSVVTFGYNAIRRLGWTQVPEMITLPSQGTTNYVSGLFLADKLLHDGAVAGSENQKLVIFLGDGEVTDGYYDGQLHNEVSGTFIHEGEANMSLEETVEVMLLDLLYGDLADASDPYLCINSLGGIQERVYTCEIRNTQPETLSTVRFLRDLCLDLNALPGYEDGVITDFDALESFVFDYYGLPYADKVNWIYSISTAELPTRTCDLYETTKYAFLEFMDSNPDVCVHTVGFSSEINVPKADMLGVQKTGFDVLQYMAQFGGGEYHYADSAQTLAEEITSICFMTNTEMTDTLSAYVQAAEAPELKVVQKAVDGSSEVVLYENGALTGAGEEILESDPFLDPATGMLTVKFKPGYIVSSSYIYSASFNVQLTPEAYTQYVTDGGTYPHVGHPDTDHSAIITTSSGQEGYFSNEEGEVTWTVSGSLKEKPFPHPVVQIPESRLYELPHTGGSGTRLYMLGGLGLISVSLACGIRRRRRAVTREANM